MQRVIPVVKQLAKETNAPISVDTVKPQVAQRALDAGAVIVNDISGLHFCPELAEVAAKYGASMVLMHTRSSPKTMQEKPVYENLIEEICTYLQEGVDRAKKAGIRQIFVDPGIGFGKTLEHNLTVLKKLSEFKRFGYPVLAGPSRKSFIGKILDLPVGERMEGTAAAVAASIMNGASVVRVHDVKEMKRVAAVLDAIVRA